MRCPADDRQALEQLCRYISRPALSDERVQLNDASQVELKLETPWRDRTTNLLISSLEIIQRLAAPNPQTAAAPSPPNRCGSWPPLTTRSGQTTLEIFGCEAVVG